eukprot:scaffold86146_cov43-Phaeocystis_antarctica.AAC.2
MRPANGSATSALPAKPPGWLGLRSDQQILTSPTGYVPSPRRTASKLWRRRRRWPDMHRRDALGANRSRNDKSEVWEIYSGQRSCVQRKQ